MADTVTFFKRYPFEVNQKINIEDGPRKGDWVVIGTSAKKVILQCPVSGFKVEWDRFCYHVEEREAKWPS